MNARDSITKCLRDFLNSELAGKIFRYRNDPTVIRIQNISYGKNFIPVLDKNDISLSHFLFKVAYYSYDENYPEYTQYTYRYMTMPELFTSGWEECDNEYYHEISNKAREHFNDMEKES